MNTSDWFLTSAPDVLVVLLSGVGVYAALLLFTRLAGLRSFSKMSGFDFAITVAFGTVLASTMLSPGVPLLRGVAALAVLFGIQYGVSRARRAWSAAERVFDNRPRLVMAGEEVLQDHLDAVQMTEDDLRSKLRMAGVTHPREILAVVVETTGDVAVITGDGEVDAWMFKNVIGAEHLRRTEET